MGFILRTFCDDCRWEHGESLNPPVPPRAAPFLPLTLQSRPRKAPTHPLAQPPLPQQIPIPYPPGWTPGVAVALS